MHRLAADFTVFKVILSVVDRFGNQLDGGAAIGAGQRSEVGGEGIIIHGDASIWIVSSKQWHLNSMVELVVIIQQRAARQPQFALLASANNQPFGRAVELVPLLTFAARAQTAATKATRSGFTDPNAGTGNVEKLQLRHDTATPRN